MKYNLDQVMTERNVTERDLVAAGVNRNTLKGFRSGLNARVDIAVLDQLCSILDCTVGDLLVYEKQEKASE
ncbi:helix-turn-helix domain-containing protein [Heliophilum fasciatum]|uniref:helix-turn-helix domain-containing protein n=1 Tax=Heliophilum fasciatum TaxID=35700 RepID=UPI001045A2F8